MKATKVNIEWLKAMFLWLYTRPYEHDQRAFAAFLNYTENIDKRGPDLYPQIPSWFVFDVHTKFINWPQWTGKLEDIVLIHFMDGEAFSLYGRSAYDPSIPKVRNNPMPLFLGDDLRTKLDEMDVEPAAGVWTIPGMRELMAQQWQSKPALRQLCGILPNVDSSFKGYGWIAKELNVTDPNAGLILIDRT